MKSLLMIPSTGTMAILLTESLSSTTASSNFGPAVRTCAALPLSSRRTKCKGLKTRVITNKQAKTTAITFQPPPPRRGGGWVSLGGDGSNGGGVGGVGAFGGFIG